MSGAKSQDWVHHDPTNQLSRTELISGAKSQRVGAPEINQRTNQSGMPVNQTS